MDDFAQMEIFFMISSFGFIVLWALLAVLLFYATRATRAFGRILEKAEKDIDQIGDTTKEMLEEMQDSFIFNLLFRKKHRQYKK